MGGVMSRNLLHVLPFHRINLNSISDGDDDVLHDLGALGHGAAHFFGMGEREARRVPDAAALASRPRFPAAGHVVDLEEQYPSTTSGVLAVGRLDARADARVRISRSHVSRLLG